MDLFFESLWAKFRRRNRLRSSVPSPSPPPWDDWDLDPKFFASLSRWTLDHPESSLDRVMDKICLGIDNGEELLQLIPDSPFPARGLIGALAHLVKLGTTISKATRDVQAFAKEIVHWVGKVRSAFGLGKGGRFTSQTRRNLREMRSLIDEICKWANARLVRINHFKVKEHRLEGFYPLQEDGRWSRIGHGLTISKEIAEFQSRIAKTRSLFLDLSVINLCQGQDAILERIRDLVAVIQQMQKEQLVRLQSSILDELESQKQAEAREQFLSQILSTRAMTNTAYDDQGKRPCDEDTRTDILADIRKWIYGISNTDKGFLWLTGDPGSGKSAVTASIARECKDAGILWAQFFINRNIDKTTNPASYFPSIARQLADHSPEVALAIHDTLKEQPSLMDDISQSQAERLFVKSLSVASLLDPSKPVVIIIDGLDETDPSRLRYTADIFSKALVALPKNAKVFISSRTEDDIRRPFSVTFHVNHVKHVHLDTSSRSSIRDVSTFLTRGIGNIADQNNLDWTLWPGEERMVGLCLQASGLFIWAFTVLRFIQDQLQTSGTECLDDVLDEVNTKGMSDINALYGTILRLTHKNQTDPWVFERFRRIVGCIVTLKEPLCVADLQSLLDLRKSASGACVDIEHQVRRLRTVLVAGVDAVDGKTVPRLHKSFFEFITSDRVDPRFRVDMDISNGEIATQCLRQLSQVNSTWHPRFLTSIRYAGRFWASHLPHTEGMMAGLAVVGSGNVSSSLLQEASRDCTQTSVDHVEFFPDGKQAILSSTLRNAIHLLDFESGALVEQPLKGHTDSVRCVAFSPDGKHIISGSHDRTLRLWDARSGQQIGSPLYGHNGIVKCVAFSPDGRHIISGSHDRTLRLWDARSGWQIRLVLHHTSSVECVAVSLDGKHIISGSRDCTLHLWDAQSGQTVRFFYGHNDAVVCVAFSPDGRHIISGSLDGTLRFWHAQSGCQIGLSLNCTSSVLCVAFSPHGRQFTSGTADGKLRLWNARSHQPISLPMPFSGHTQAVLCVAFSADGKYIISGSRDQTLCLWDARIGQQIGLPFIGHIGAVHCVAFSPENNIISGSYDHTLRLWDIESHQPFQFPFYAPAKVSTIALSPDARNIALSSFDNTVTTWNAQTGQRLGVSLKAKQVISLAFSPEGNHIAALSSNGTVYLWLVQSQQLLASYSKDHIKELTSIAFSPDGKLLTSACIDGTTHIWDAMSGLAINSSPLSDISLLDTSKPIYFSMERGWCYEEVDDVVLQWYPVDSPHFGLWAYVEDKVVRNNRNGVASITNMCKSIS